VTATGGSSPAPPPTSSAICGRCAISVSAVDIDFELPDPAASIAEMRRFKDVVLPRL